MERIITINLMGGLGNQMFQIFTVLAYAIRHGWQFQFQNDEILKVGTHRPTYWNSIFKELIPFLGTGPTSMYKEISFRYNEIPLFSGNCRLFGYYQSYKYFCDQIVLIIELLNLKEQIANTREQWSHLFGTYVISMHFRITGYREIEHCHPVQTYDYYYNSLKAIKKQNGARVLYFCQPEDTKEVNDIIDRLHVDFDGDFDFIRVPDEVPDWQQMLLMASCDINIIANSSFSWWGAYLNSRGSVYYPSNWFGPGLNHDISDMIPPSWIEIRN